MSLFAKFCSIFYFLSNGTHHPDVEEKGWEGRAVIVRAARNYIIKDNRLHYMNRSRTRLVVMSAEERDAVLKECHDDPATGGHYGEHGTVKKIVNAYFWESIRSDTKKWVAECPQCQRCDRIRTVAPVMRPIWV